MRKCCLVDVAKVEGVMGVDDCFFYLQRASQFMNTHDGCESTTELDLAVVDS